MKDMDSWFNEYAKDKIFRCWFLKRKFTPYEEKNAFEDETLYEDDTCDYIQIVQLFELPDGDVMVGYVSIEEWEEHLNPIEKGKIINYRKWSEMEIAYCALDQLRESWN